MAHRSKSKPKRWWRKRGYVKLWCDNCPRQWTVYDTGRPAADGRRARRAARSGSL